MRTGSRFRILVSAVVLTLTASIAAGATAGVRATAATPSAPHTLYISVANRYLTMPHRVVAGQYYVQVRTSDARSSVQVVRPPAGYTPRQFLDARTHWNAVYNSGAPPLAAYTAFVRSVIFMGGAQVARGGVGSFATGLSAGTYWLYEDTYDGPTHLSRIVVLTVVGTPPAQTHPTAAGVVRFSTTGGRLTLPANLPTSGWLLAIGGAPLNTLTIAKLRPGVTQADLDTFGVCFTWDSPPAPENKDCFESGLNFGGKVSAGASVFWYYRLPPGEYVAGNIAPSAYYDRPLWYGQFARFTIS